MSTPKELIEAAKLRIRERQAKQVRDKARRLELLDRQIKRTAKREAARLQSGAHAAELLEEAATLALDKDGVSELQVALMLVKYRAGIRPGDEQWTPEDQKAFDVTIAKPDEEPVGPVEVDDVDRILRIQFSKLVNFFSSDLDPRWGGTFYQDSPIELAEAFDAFCAERVDENPWAHKRTPASVWGPGNIEFRADPWPGFREPLEPYFTCGGVTLRLEEAASVLGIGADELLELKLEVFRDEDVIVQIFTERVP